MESFSFETLLLLLILLPGFLSSTILSALAVRKERTQLDKIIEALVFSFVLYAAWVLFVLRRPITVEATRIDEKTARYALSLEPGEIFWLFALALILGLVLSLLVTHDVHTKILRAVKITHLSTRASVWHDVFSDIARYVVVEFGDGRRVIGWPRYISDTPEESSLFLENAAWVLDDGTEIQIAGPGILVTKNMPIQNIIFLDAKAPTKKAPDTKAT